MNPTNEVLYFSSIAILIFTLGVLLIWSIFSLLRVRKDKKMAAENQANNLYEKLIRFQIEYPEFLNLCRKWTPDKINQVFEQVSDEDRQWAKYYIFAELCIGYCNTVLHAHKRKLIDNDLFKNQYEPLLAKILEQHNPIIEDLISEGRHNPKFIIEFRQNLQERG